MATDIHVQMQLVDGSVVELSCSPTTSLTQLLHRLEKLEDEFMQEHEKLVQQGMVTSAYVRRRFAAYQGVPDVENIGPQIEGRSIIQIKINVTGTMEPIITVGETELTPTSVDYSSYTLYDMCHLHPLHPTDSQQSSSVVLKMSLRHRYRAPTMSEAEQHAAVENLKRQLGFSGQATAPTTAKPTPSRTPVAAAPVPKPVASLTVTQASVPQAPKPLKTPSTSRLSSGAGTDAAEEGEGLDTGAVDAAVSNDVNHEESRAVDEASEELIEGVPRVREEEVADSDDDSFYELNAGDLRVLASIYQGNKADKEKQSGISIINVDDEKQSATTQGRFFGGGRAVGSELSLHSEKPLRGPSTASESKEQRAAALRDRLLAKMTGKAGKTPSSASGTATTTSKPAEILKTLKLRVRLPPQATNNTESEVSSQVLQSIFVDVEVSERARVRDLYNTVFECISSADAVSGLIPSTLEVDASKIDSYPFVLYTVRPPSQLSEGEKKLGNVPGLESRSVVRLQWK